MELEYENSLIKDENEKILSLQHAIKEIIKVGIIEISYVHYILLFLYFPRRIWAVVSFHLNMQFSQLSFSVGSDLFA